MGNWQTLFSQIQYKDTDLMVEQKEERLLEEEKRSHLNWPQRSKFHQMSQIEIASYAKGKLSKYHEF